MKKIFSGALSVFVPYAIFISDLQGSVKSLLVSIVCGFILAFYIFKAGGWMRLPRGGKILSLPTIILVFVAMLNVAFALEINPILLWLGYFGATALAFIASARLNPR